MTDRPRALLDSTAIIGAGFGNSSAFRHLLRDAKDGRIEVLVPETVVAETVFVYRRKLFNARNTLKMLPDLLRAAGQEPPLLDSKKLMTLAAQELRGKLVDAGVKIAPAPRIDPDAVVQRIHDRRKPTKQFSLSPEGQELSEQGESFRDQLIWEHVRTAAEAGPLILVSDNTHDFAQTGSRRNGRATLHKDLLEDLAEDRREGRSTGQVDLVLDVAQLVLDHLQKEDVIADMKRLLEGEAGDLLREEAIHQLTQGGVTVEGYIPEIGVEGDIEEATLTSLGGKPSLELVDAYLESQEGDPRAYGVALSLTGEGEVDWFVSGPTSWDLEEFSASVEGETSGGGFIADVERSTVILPVTGSYCPSDQAWTELTFEAARQTDSERRRRSHEHVDRQFAREQDLGLQPSDDEIAEHD